MSQQEIIRSIVIQGTLLDSDVDTYTLMIKEMDQEVKYPDPISKAISTAFKLCAEGAIDPWNVDLKAFSRIFSSIITDDFSDFGLAGYLLSQAWRILLEKTEDAVGRRAEPEMEENDDIEPAEELPLMEKKILQLYEPVKHKQKRQVFLVELLDAMKSAYKRTRAPRKKYEHFENIELSVMEGIIEELHSEEPEKEIEDLYRRILSLPGSTFAIENYWGITKEDQASFMVYCLFLARDRRLRMMQKKPYSSIYVDKSYSSL